MNLYTLVSLLILSVASARDYLDDWDVDTDGIRNSVIDKVNEGIGDCKDDTSTHSRFVTCVKKLVEKTNGLNSDEEDDIIEAAQRYRTYRESSRTYRESRNEDKDDEDREDRNEDKDKDDKSGDREDRDEDDQEEDPEDRNEDRDEDDKKEDSKNDDKDEDDKEEDREDKESKGNEKSSDDSKNGKRYLRSL